LTLNARKKGLEAREKAINKRSAELDDREKAIKPREDALTRQSGAIYSGKEAAEQREQKLLEQVAALKSQLESKERQQTDRDKQTEKAHKQELEAQRKEFSQELGKIEGKVKPAFEAFQSKISTLEKQLEKEISDKEMFRTARDQALDRARKAEAKLDRGKTLG
jgi:chromosome segregation ATPase